MGRELVEGEGKAPASKFGIRDVRREKSTRKIEG